MESQVGLSKGWTQRRTATDLLLLWCQPAAWYYQSILTVAGVSELSDVELKDRKCQRLVGRAGTLYLSHSNAQSLTPTGCPPIRFNSDMNYPELVKSPQVKEFSHKSWVSRLPTPLSKLAANSGFPQPPFRFKNLPEWHTELRKALHLWLLFYYREHKWLDEEMQ